MARFVFLATTLAIKFLLPIWPSRSSFGRLQFPFWGSERLHAFTRSACRMGSGCFQRNLLQLLDGWVSKHSLNRTIFGSTPWSSILGPVIWLRLQSFLGSDCDPRRTVLCIFSGTPRGIFLCLLKKADLCKALCLCCTNLQANP